MIIDITRLLGRAMQKRLPTGVDRVGLEYVRHYGHDADALVRYAGRWVFLRGRDAQTLFAGLLHPNAPFLTEVRRLVGKAYCLNWTPPRTGTLLLNAGHSGLDSYDYRDQVHKYQLKAFYLLHDLIPVQYPEYSRAGEAERHVRRLEVMLTSGAGIIAISQDTLQQLRAYARNTRQVLPPAKVALLGPASLVAADQQRPLNKPYFVMLGTIEPRKNHSLILHVWRELVKSLGDQAPTLVIIGQRGWECEQVIDLLERSPGLKNHVIEHANCSDAALAAWLGHAQALLFPTFAEGYGMPLVEALAQQCPVIASHLPVFHEIAGDVPDYLNPLDGLGWSQAIIDYSFSVSPRRATQLARIKRFKAPSWSEHFRITDEFLTRAVVAS
jgi:glycosyltransferase involved in cell wall biosynthesis